MSLNLQNLKFKYFGHDMIIFHERDILKGTGKFKHLTKENKEHLLNDISILMQNSQFTIIACAIQKDQMPTTHHTDNLYYLAVRFGLQKLHDFLQEKGQLHQLTHVIFEQRGKHEDAQLYDEVCKIQQTHQNQHHPYPFEILIMPKSVNSTGLQVADLVARPIGNHILKPDQPNRAYAIIQQKLYANGLTVLPKK